MERLTKRELIELKNGEKIVGCNSKDEDCNDYCMHGYCRWNDKALKKLKEYEDLEEQLEKVYGEHDGLLETAVKSLVKYNGEKPRKARLLTDEDADRWEEYKNLEEQGLLLRLPAPLVGVEMFELENVGTWLRLPCKPGDKVYEIEGVAWKGYDWKYPSYEHAYARETIFTLEKYNSFGLSIFLTKEECEKKIAEKMQEAEAALKEMGE